MLGESELVTVVRTRPLFWFIFAFGPPCFSPQCWNEEGHSGSLSWFELNSLLYFSTKFLSLKYGFDASDTYCLQCREQASGLENF